LLRDFADKNGLWFNTIDENCYIGEGAEQKVYLEESGLLNSKQMILSFMKVGTTISLIS
jgi:hypothetical protein